jgi:hypothetical protein
MPRATRSGDEEVPFLENIMDFGDGAPTLVEKLEMVQMIRRTGTDPGRRLDQLLLERLARFAAGLTQAQAAQAQLTAMLERFDAPPWYPALFLRPMDTALGPRALVLHGGAQRLVALGEGVELSALATGDEVFLGKDLNVVTGKSPWGAPRCGETAFFERVTGDGRCVLRWRDEEVVVDAASGLVPAGLQRGDQVRWDRSAWMAFETIERPLGQRFLLTEIPPVGVDQVGGQDANLELLLAALTAALTAPGTATRYGLSGRQSVLMVGPSGVGKTLMARVAAAEVARLSGAQCRFGVVKPGEWESPWVGETQQNIRDCFRALRDAAAEGYAVLFLDEIEAAGRIRGGAASQHADKFLAALLAEIDGFSGRGGVAIVAATNRKDLVDPALLERLSDVEITVRRPDLRGARAIFAVHLAPSLPFHDNGATASETRDEMIEYAVSRLYAPNADNALSVVRLRDGKTRTISARELVSGRLIEQICRAARQAALHRDLRSGDAGMRLADMEHAVCAALERLATTLTPHNAHAYLADLPQDVDVVSVEPIVRHVPRVDHYVNAA